MNYGIEGGKFYIEYAGCARQPGSLKEEADSRAQEIYRSNNNVLLCLSSGLDSQIALASFLRQGIPVQCAFLRMGGFNDNELENVRILEKKWGFKAEVVDINPNSVREELEYLKGELDVHANHCLQHLFVKKLPGDCTIVQVLHDPWTITSRKLNQHFLYHGYYDPEIARDRALKAIPRSGSIEMFGDSHEFFLACISDPLFQHFLGSWVYYDGNGLQQYEHKLSDLLRYEYYIKPMLYSKHWGSELQYFSKFSGYENIDWLKAECRKLKNEKIVLVEWNKLLSQLSTIGAPTQRYWQLSPEIQALLAVR